MKAIVVENCGGPEVLVYRDAEKPAPKAGEALVKLEAVGVNYIDFIIARDFTRCRVRSFPDRRPQVLLTPLVPT